MTIHFAAAVPAANRFMACRITPRLCRAANDNPPANEPLSDTLLRAALKHFGRYGMGAAENARNQAERAFFTGDREAYDWWLSVCRTLDKRIAAQIGATAPTGSQGSGGCAGG